MVVTKRLADVTILDRGLAWRMFRSWIGTVTFRLAVQRPLARLRALAVSPFAVALRRAGRRLVGLNVVRCDENGSALLHATIDKKLRKEFFDDIERHPAEASEPAHASLADVQNAGPIELAEHLSPERAGFPRQGDLFGRVPDIETHVALVCPIHGHRTSASARWISAISEVSEAIRACRTSIARAIACTRRATVSGATPILAPFFVLHGVQST